MKLLLDSHAFLWWLAEAPKLSAGARRAVADPLSIVHVGADLVEEIAENDFIELPMSARIFPPTAAARAWPTRSRISARGSSTPSSSAG